MIIELILGQVYIFMMCGQDYMIIESGISGGFRIVTELLWA